VPIVSCGLLASSDRSGRSEPFAGSASGFRCRKNSSVRRMFANSGCGSMGFRGASSVRIGSPPGMRIPFEDTNRPTAGREQRSRNLCPRASQAALKQRRLVPGRCRTCFKRGPPVQNPAIVRAKTSSDLYSPAARQPHTSDIRLTPCLRFRRREPLRYARTTGAADGHVLRTTNGALEAGQRCHNPRSMSALRVSLEWTVLI